MNDSQIAPCSVELRPRSELGTTRTGGLSGRHHFSFAAYQRPDRLEWGALRAMSLYRLEPGADRTPTFHAGFEIVTLMTGGCVRRTGTFAPPHPLRAGAVELVSTGTGANLGLTSIGEEPATYIEIWVCSSEPGRRARRQSLRVSPIGLEDPVATGPTPAPGALPWRAAARLHRILMMAGDALETKVDDRTCIYLAVLTGVIVANGERAEINDALALFGPGMLTVRADNPSELLLVQTAAEGPGPATVGT